MGEKILEERLIRKLLRSLPKRFDMKVTAIEEAQDSTSMKVDELFGLLLTFEMSLDDKPKKKKKEIVLQSSVDEDCDIVGRESDESLANSISLLSEQFNRTSNSSAKHKPGSSFPSNQFKTLNHKKEADKLGASRVQREKSFKCRECEGYRHFQAERPNFLKRQGKSYILTLVDDNPNKNSDFKEVTRRLLVTYHQTSHHMRIQTMSYI